MIIVFIS